MDRFRAMSVFITVAGAGSLSAAAQQLDQPLTTVSRQLAALEALVGTTLIARTTRHMALTEAGRRYLDVCRRVLEELESAHGQMAGRDDELAGSIVLTAPVAFGRMHLLPVVNQFLKRHPRVEVRLLLVDRIVDFYEEGVDVALRIGALPDSSLVASRIGAVRLVTCAAPSYLTSHAAPAIPAELVNHACISFSALPGGVRWIYKSAKHGRQSVRVLPRLAVNTADGAVDAAIAGLGVTRVLSYQAEGALQRGRLRAVLDAFEDAAIPVHLIQRPVRHPQPRVQTFMAFAANALRNRIADPPARVTSRSGS